MIGQVPFVCANLGIGLAVWAGRLYSRGRREDRALEEFLVAYRQIKGNLKNGDCLPRGVIDKVWDDFNYNPDWNYHKHDSETDRTYSKILRLNRECEARHGEK